MTVAALPEGVPSRYGRLAYIHPIAAMSGAATTRRMRASASLAIAAVAPTTSIAPTGVAGIPSRPLTVFSTALASCSSRRRKRQQRLALRWALGDWARRKGLRGEGAGISVACFHCSSRLSVLVLRLARISFDARQSLCNYLADVCVIALDQSIT